MKKASTALNLSSKKISGWFPIKKLQRTYPLTRLQQIFALITLIGLPIFAQAEVETYGGLDAQFGLIDINGESFNPVIGRLNGGLWLREGIGLEAMLGAALSDDSSGSLTVDVPNLLALSIRFQSPEDMHTKAYILLGYARYELDGSLADASFPGSETFAGPAVAVGFLRRTPLAENISAYFEFSSYLANEEIDFGAVTLGLRYGY